MYGDIVDSYNINSFIPELRLEDTPDILNNIRQTSAFSSLDVTAWDNYFNSLKELDQGYFVNLIRNTEDLTRLTGQNLVKANQDARNAILAHNDAIRKSIKEQSLLTKAGNVLASSLSALGNMAVSFAIGKVI